jgi:hypothetical protein
MMDQIGYALLYILNGIFIAFIIYVGVWTPKERMKGHSGRSKCKCCSEKVVYHEDDSGCWFKTIYDEDGRRIYMESNDGVVFDNRKNN